mgnify:CR=1 FL=1
MNCRRLLTLNPDNEPLWVRLYVQKIDDVWAAMLVGDDVLPPEPGTLKGLGFFGATPEEAEDAAKAYLGCSEPVN